MSEDFYSIKSQEQKDFYNKTAQKYNEWHVDQESAKIVDAWNFANLEKFIHKYKKDKIFRCLNLGCGTGRLSQNLFKIAEEVYGLDQSEEVLKIAGNMYPQLKLSCGEAINTPYENDFFDLVIINGSLHHFFAVEKTFKEVHRILKKDGLFVLLGEPNANYLKFYNPFFYAWIINRIFAKVFVRKNRQEDETIEPEAEIYIPNKLKRQLIAQGFKPIEFYSYDYFHRSENSLILSFYRKYLDFEHKYIARMFKNLGSAIQCFAIKE